MKNLAFVVGISCMLVGSVQASSFSRKANGTAAAQSLKLVPGARAVALGEAYSSLADDALALYWNPAGLSDMSSAHSVHFMHTLYLAGINFGYAGYAMRLPAGLGHAGAYIQYLNIGSIDMTDNVGNVTGEFSPSDQTFALGWARKIGPLPFGVAGKFISSKIANSASTYAVDFGVRSPWRFMRDKLAFAATLKNVGPGLKFHEVRDPLPMELRVGSNLIVYDNLSGKDIMSEMDRVIVSADAVFPKDGDTWLALGVEHSKIMGSPISGRAGFNGRSAQNQPGFAGIFFGFGVALERLDIDYALAPMGDLGAAHRLSLGFDF